MQGMEDPTLIQGPDPRPPMHRHQASPAQAAPHPKTGHQSRLENRLFCSEPATLDRVNPAARQQVRPLNATVGATNSRISENMFFSVPPQLTPVPDILSSLMTVGSLKHDEGLCKPCLLFFQGLCTKGSQCNFCHLPHDTERRGPGRNLIKDPRREHPQEDVEVRNRPAMSSQARMSTALMPTAPSTSSSYHAY